MSDHATILIVGSFDDPNGAETALKQVKAKAGHSVHDAALVARDDKNQLHIRDTKDWGWGKGALAGGLAGLLVGVIAPPAGLAIAAFTGAGLGALGAGLHDAGIATDTLKALGATLALGTSAVVLAVEPDGAHAAEELLAHAGAATVREGLSQEAMAVFKSQLGPAEGTQQSIERGMLDEAKFQ